jgi:hypothetical protein
VQNAAKWNISAPFFSTLHTSFFKNLNPFFSFSFSIYSASTGWQNLKSLKRILKLKEILMPLKKIKSKTINHKNYKQNEKSNTNNRAKTKKRKSIGFYRIRKAN